MECWRNPPNRWRFWLQYPKRNPPVPHLWHLEQPTLGTVEQKMQINFFFAIEKKKKLVVLRWYLWIMFNIFGVKENIWCDILGFDQSEQMNIKLMLHSVWKFWQIAINSIRKKSLIWYTDLNLIRNISGSTPPKPARRNVEQNGYAAMLSAKMSAGVVPEVNFRKRTCTPLPIANKAAHSGFETQRRRHQKV